MTLEQSWVRFALSGTLILCFSIADHLAHRGERVRPRMPRPWWVGPLVLVSIGAFYLLIKPTGGPLLGGAGNLVGIAVCGLACFMRTVPTVRYPDLAARGLFYLGLPVAVGVPLGLLVLSVPACVASVVCAQRAERWRLGLAATAAGPSPDPRYRLVRGIW